ncbi:O-linked N-acetylglucosamine transferase, ogt, putative [Entamoeba invadens IP1]|uniref:O-linked N-acetylglucosamine transferase, ogt, putative n=1 Tax=Entamoeba invadens IP1 TaxID=370355 RepID=A0A0A1U7K5_ENTIV|nr:O-linked N-acetylglucosamine transferase, ogt, putative [Entamoeba invadens IP1]ELP87970.1 O-linked N-acetylglucosamine transferase, ogt, putative [Entamoeba invadens IP1]|eukprot:XP_004254741.1 O-linked N-acetylglucosamine transferase, ogt, putative [Entamoeba invadens IP1]
MSVGEYLFGSDSEDITGLLSESSNTDSSDSSDLSDSKPKTRKIPDSVKKLIGEASMCYVKKEYSQATEYALEAIKVAPQIPDSYHTLGMIYSDLGDKKTARDYFMIAAHMTRTDGELWKRLADMFKEDGDEEQYYYCLSKAVLHDPKNVDLLYERVKVGTQMSDSRGVLSTFQALIALDGTATTAKQIATALITEKRKKEAASVVLGGVKQRIKENKDVELSLGNILMELLLDNEMLDEFSEFYTNYVKTHDESTFPVDMQANVCIFNIRKKSEETWMPYYLYHLKNINPNIVDLSVLIANELMKKKEYQKAMELYEKIRSFEGMDNAVIWGNLAVCYWNLGNEPLAFQYGENSHKECGYRGDVTVLLMRKMLQEGEYDKMCEISDHYFESLEQMNDIEVFQNMSEQNDVIEILRMKMKGFYRQDNYEKCYETFLWIFGKVIQKEETDLIKSRIKQFRFSRSKKWRMGAVLSILGVEMPVEEKKEKKHTEESEIEEDRLFQTKRKKRKDTAVTVAPPIPNEEIKWDQFDVPQKVESLKQKQVEPVETFNENEKTDRSETEESSLVDKKTRNTDRDNRKVIEIAGTFVLLEEVLGIERIKKYITWHITCAAVINKMDECKQTIESLITVLGHDEDNEVAIRTSFINICLRYSSFEAAIFQLKALCLVFPNRKDLWFFFNKIIVLSRRQTNPGLLKYFSRMHSKYPKEEIITIILGNLFLTTCQYNKALTLLFDVYDNQKNSALLNLSISLCFLGDVANRNTIDKSSVMVNSLTYLKRYLELCGFKKEGLYNVGRFYHQLDVLYLASNFYEQALSIIPKNSAEALLDREIAFNLSLIYAKAGNEDLVIKIRWQYLQF